MRRICLPRLTNPSSWRHRRLLPLEYEPAHTAQPGPIRADKTIGVQSIPRSSASGSG